MSSRFFFLKQIWRMISKMSSLLTETFVHSIFSFSISILWLSYLFNDYWIYIKLKTAFELNRFSKIWKWNGVQFRLKRVISTINDVKSCVTCSQCYREFLKLGLVLKKESSELRAYSSLSRSDSKCYSFNSW